MKRKPCYSPGVYGVIYLIENKLNGKRYVGQTVQHVQDRFAAHARSVNPSAISRAFRKDGHENFSFSILEECATLEALNAAEAKWIAFHNCMAPQGYNLTTGGDGYTMSLLTRAKMSAAAQGRTHSAEARAKMSATRRGCKHPGSSQPGERNPKSKLNEEKVREIRALYDTGQILQRELSDLFDVTQSHIANILARRCWREPQQAVRDCRDVAELEALCPEPSSEE